MADRRSFFTWIGAVAAVAASPALLSAKAREPLVAAERGGEPLAVWVKCKQLSRVQNFMRWRGFVERPQTIATDDAFGYQASKGRYRIAAAVYDNHDGVLLDASRDEARTEEGPHWTFYPMKWTADMDELFDYVKFVDENAEREP
jgi:hypothetical protein